VPDVLCGHSPVFSNEVHPGDEVVVQEDQAIEALEEGLGVRRVAALHQVIEQWCAAEVVECTSLVVETDVTELLPKDF
jgi:hypothetical protein